MPRFGGGVVGQAIPRVVSLLREDPVLVAALAGAVLLAVALAVYLWRRYPRTPGARFERALARADAVTVLMHPNPDPDAMAAALGVAHLADQVDTATTIKHPGELRHPENRAFRTVLDLDLEAIEERDDLGDDPIVLVDHNEPRGFAGAGGVAPYAVVDHHPGNGSGSAFTDVRTGYGACASILAEYLRETGVDPVDGVDVDDDVPADALSPLVATGLLYGVLADTNHLTRGCSDAEFEASAYLYPGIDEEALDRIANPPVDAEMLDVKARAITERIVRSSFVVSDVGEVTNVDAIPQAAEELLQLEGVTAVVVVGHADETLHLSGRSRDDRVHMGDALAAAVEDIPMSNAGGHARMGGGQVSVPHMEGLRPESGMSREEFYDRLFASLSGDL